MQKDSILHIRISSEQEQEITTFLNNNNHIENKSMLVRIAINQFIGKNVTQAPKHKQTTQKKTKKTNVTNQSTIFNFPEINGIYNYLKYKFRDKINSTEKQEAWLLAIELLSSLDKIEKTPCNEPAPAREILKRVILPRHTLKALQEVVNYIAKD